MTGLANGIAKADWHRLQRGVLSKMAGRRSGMAESIKLAWIGHNSGLIQQRLDHPEGWLMVQVVDQFHISTQDVRHLRIEWVQAVAFALVRIILSSSPIAAESSTDLRSVLIRRATPDSSTRPPPRA